MSSEEWDDPIKLSSLQAITGEKRLSEVTLDPTYISGGPHWASSYQALNTQTNQVKSETDSPYSKMAWTRAGPTKISTLK